MPRFRQKRLLPDEVDFIMKMKKLEYSNSEIARKLGLSEGAIRYRLKQSQSPHEDGRKHKPSVLDSYKEVLALWVSEYQGHRRRPSLKILHENLKEYHGFGGSYDAFRRYLRKHFPGFFNMKSYVRMETPPGVLVQVDWKEDFYIQMSQPGHHVRLHALILTLCFSRKTVVIFSERKDLDSFIRCHQSGFIKLGGLVELSRTDCLKSAVVKWRGNGGNEVVLNEKYRKYLSELGIEAFPSRPGTPTDKGKVEKRIGDLFSRLDITHRVYRNMEELQNTADAKLEELEKRWRCGATGLTVAESFSYEQKHLRSLPGHFPSLPVAEKRTSVRTDGTVYFCGNYYQVEKRFIGKPVLCIHSGTEIIIYCDGNEIDRHEYLPGTQGLVKLSEKALRDKSLKISGQVRNWGLEVARRQVDIYQEIMNDKRNGGVI